MVEINRKTKETDIKCKIDLNGCGKSNILEALMFASIGETYETIDADLLNIKLSLVKYRVSKAKELLAKQLEVEKL